MHDTFIGGGLQLLSNFINFSDFCRYILAYVSSSLTSNFRLSYRPVTGKVEFPGWDGKFLFSGVEEGNQ